MLYSALHLVFPNQTKVPIAVKSFLIFTNFAVSSIETFCKHRNAETGPFLTAYFDANCKLLNRLKTLPEVHFSIIFWKIHYTNTALGLQRDLKAKKLEYSLTSSKRIFDCRLVSYPQKINGRGSDRFIDLIFIDIILAQ